ncbi:hypothetical protein DH2020_025907 [Rehmannia glutinosa]|uniref:Uncharacterized protein n=1 Tax=Rehmannia glutinosa TaxID=99300 RepID=A0ABR0W0V7_REHGL
MGQMGCRNKGPTQSRPSLAWDLRHGGGRRHSIRRGSRTLQGPPRQTQLPENVRLILPPPQPPTPSPPSLFQTADGRDYWEYSQLLRSSGDFQPQQSTTSFENIFNASSLAALYSHQLNSSSSSVYPSQQPFISSSTSSYPMLFSSGQTIHFRPQGNNQRTRHDGDASSNFPAPSWTSGHYPA